MLQRLLPFASSFVIVVLGAASLGAQVPEKFTNLQVLPKDIPRAELVASMRAITAALGVRCSQCHVERQNAEELDFAADDKEEKQIARAMMRMTRSINGEYLQKLPVGDMPRQGVECVTCHQGSLKPPRPLHELLLTRVSEGGVVAAIDEYRRLRKESLESGLYDFRERSLNRVATRLREHKRFDDALAILRFNAEQFPDSAAAQTSIADTAAEKGDFALARESYQKALAIDPKNHAATLGLAELEKKSAPRF